MLLEGHERRIYQIRRLKCPKCGKLHRELPDFLTPFKQYSTEIIAGVLDGSVTSEDDESVDYPCEETIFQWQHWLMVNQLRIDGYLKSIGYRLLGFSEELLISGMSLLTELRSSIPEWLFGVCLSDLSLHRLCFDVISKTYGSSITYSSKWY